jgi:hypothetical protein
MKTLRLHCRCGFRCDFCGPTVEAIVEDIDRSGWVDTPESEPDLCPACAGVEIDQQPYRAKETP